MNYKNIRTEVYRITTPKLKFEYSNECIQNENDKLKYNISNIFYDKPISLAYAELYNLVENLCTLKQDDELQEDLQILICEYLHLQLQDLLCYNDFSFLLALKRLWFLYCHKSKLIRNIYLYMELTSSRIENRKYSIWQLCADSFRQNILQDQRIREKLNYIFTAIDMDRQRQRVDAKLIEDIVSMFSQLELYDSYFERQYLKKTEDYYKTQRDQLLNDNIVAYFYYVQVHLVEEKHRVLNHFKTETESKVNHVLYRILIEEKLTDLFIKLEAVNIFDMDINDILTVHNQLCHLPKTNEDFCTVFGNYMLTKGKQIIFDTKNDKHFVSTLLKFKDRIDEIVKTCFKQHAMYVEAVRVSFKKFVNLRKYKPAQFLAKFIDGKMRDKQIPEDLLDKIIVLFRYIQGKDVFEAYYKRYLAKRLLLGKSSSQDAEKYMIGKLKLECGDGFTSKLEGMLRDIDLSENLVQAFKQRRTADPIEFSAYILTNSFWPTFTKFKVNLFDKMLHYHNLYHDFYKAKYSGRSLEWIGSLDSCLLKAVFVKGPKELQVSLFQALILLLFNDNDRITYKYMREQLNLEDTELCRTLTSLLNGKVQIMTIANRESSSPSTSENSTNIDEDDVFAINEHFSNKLFRIKMNQLQYKDTEEEQKITEDEVLHDRHLQIDAAVVRLMKQNQNMKHNDLIAKIYNVLKFPVNPNDIKKRIEILIERDFLARNPDDTNAYLYVA